MTDRTTWGIGDPEDLVFVQALGKVWVLPRTRAEKIRDKLEDIRHDKEARAELVVKLRGWIKDNADPVNVFFKI